MKTSGDAQRYVRVKRNSRSGFVEFEFSIGDPSLHLDMILPPAAFRAFCRDNQVSFLSTGTRDPSKRAEES